MKSLKSADTHAAKPRTRIAMKSAHIPPPPQFRGFGD